MSATVLVSHIKEVHWKDEDDREERLYYFLPSRIGLVSVPDGERRRMRLGNLISISVYVKQSKDLVFFGLWTKVFRQSIKGKITDLRFMYQIDIVKGDEFGQYLENSKSEILWTFVCE